MSPDAEPRLLRRLWLRLLATLGIAAAVLLSWWWKIDEARSPEDAPETAFGQQIDLGRSLFTPEALVLRRQPDGPDQLVMTALIENITGATQAAVFGSPPRPPGLSIDGAPLDAPEVTLLRDGEMLRELQPRLPERITLAWTLSRPWQAQPVEIGFARQTFKLRDNLYGQSSWLGFVPSARMTVEPEDTP
ncbi:hypothetical protein [Paracoccus sp. KR1-242]|uniref:hypothetical protein n=1 Tax=Paracoccus sp. KR1-242 TaxID=3410028 RepID=UPI003BFB4829